MAEMEKTPTKPDPQPKLMLFDGTKVEAALWVLLPRAFVAVLSSVILFLVIFWLQFGELPAFAFGFATFLAVLQILIIVGLRFQNRTEVHTTQKARGDWIDKIGAWWLPACAFGAFFGWLVGKSAAMYSGDPHFFHVVKVFLTIVLPIATMLPNLRYVSRNAAYIQVPVLISVTLLPILVGVNSALILWNHAGL